MRIARIVGWIVCAAACTRGGEHPVPSASAPSATAPDTSAAASAAPSAALGAGAGADAQQAVAQNDAEFICDPRFPVRLRNVTSIDSVPDGRAVSIDALDALKRNLACYAPGPHLAFNGANWCCRPGAASPGSASVTTPAPALALPADPGPSASLARVPPDALVAIVAQGAIPLSVVTVDRDLVAADGAPLAGPPMTTLTIPGVASRTGTQHGTGATLVQKGKTYSSVAWTVQITDAQPGMKTLGVCSGRLAASFGGGVYVVGTFQAGCR
jgi:hypothetical protein